MTNNNKQMVDMPFFELCNQAPVATSAVSGLTTSEDGSDRFLYYLSTSAFYRYDTVGDTWQQLANPPLAPVTLLSIRYTKKRGYHGRVLSATSNTITIPGLRGATLSNTKISLLNGQGSGQERVLTFINETVHAAGVITGTTTSSLADTTKKWEYNQWAGYMVGITFGTDATQYKKILYNDTNTLYIYDANLQPHDPWNNQYFVAAAPYALPVTTAGAQAHYQIMSSTFSVDSAWDTIPDDGTYFTTLTGGIYLLSSAAAAPFFTFQYYDIIHDSWQIKTCPQSLILAALGTDATIERTGKIGTKFTSNTGIISGTTKTLLDSGQTFTQGTYDNARIILTGGQGNGQSRRIVASSNGIFTVAEPFDIAPAANTTYEIWPNFDRIYMGGGAASAIYGYSADEDWWIQGEKFDDGICSIISCKMKGLVPFAVSSGTRLAAGVAAVNPTPTAGGTNYVIGDILTCSVGGTGAQVIVTDILAGGIVKTIKLVHSGTATGFTTGTGKATSGGSGTGCTIEITSVGVTSLVTLATNHIFKYGDVVTFSGCSEAAWNADHTIIGIPGLTTFCVVTTATAAMSTALAQGTTTIVDASKNWIPGEHIGRLVHLCVAGQAPTSQIRWISNNTANSLTVASITAGVSGTSKYAIYDSKVFGVDDQRKETYMKAYGYASGGTTTSLTDASKNWIPNQWTNYQFKIEAGQGYGSGRITITSNSSNTLNYATQTFTPNANTKYEIADSWGLATAGGTTTPITETTTKNWVTNQWAGKRLRTTGGTAPGQEATITSSTATALTTAALTATDATTTYAILSIPPRGAGIELVWNWGSTDQNIRGRYLFYPRGGGSNSADIFDIRTGKWIFGYFFSPQSELFTTGSSYAYDGVNTIYASRSAANLPIRIFAYDINTNSLKGSMTTTFLQSTSHIGNLMEVVASPDGTLEYIYCLQNTGTLLCRGLIF